MLRAFRKEKAGAENDTDKAEESCWLCGGVWNGRFSEWDVLFIQLTKSKLGHFVAGKDNHSATHNSKICNKTNKFLFITSIIKVIAKMY